MEGEIPRQEYSEEEQLRVTSFDYYSVLHSYAEEMADFSDEKFKEARDDLMPELNQSRAFLEKTNMFKKSVWHQELKAIIHDTEVNFVERYVDYLQDILMEIKWDKEKKNEMKEERIIIKEIIPRMNKYKRFALSKDLEAFSIAIEMKLKMD